MKTRFLSLLTIFLLLAGNALAAGPLDSLKGKSQVLLLFSKSRSDAQLDKQVDLLRGYRPDLRERDLVVLRTSGDEETRSVIGYTSINRGTARKLRQMFNPSAYGLTAVLVGKDGAEKHRWSHLVTPQELFKTVDAAAKSTTETAKAVETN